MSPSTASRKLGKTYPSPTPSGTSDCGCRGSRTWPKASSSTATSRVNDLGDNFDLKEGDHGPEPNTGYSIHTASDARNHERPNHLRLFREGWEPRSFADRDEDEEHIARVREMERRNKQATQEFLGRWNEAEKAERAGRKERTETD